MQTQVAPTPLTRLKWWRVVMDEAQMVERPSQAAVLARQLEATHRWAISGTPVSSGLSDIGGLLLFLRAAPWDDGSTWACSVVNPCNQGLAAGGMPHHELSTTSKHELSACSSTLTVSLCARPSSTCGVPHHEVRKSHASTSQAHAQVL